MFEIDTGAKMTAKKVVLYGPEGVGKSSLAAQFPNPLFIDTEDSTLHMDVKRLKKPTTFTEMIQMVDWVKQTKNCSTLIIDTADWAQTLAEKQVVTENNWKSIESPGYGEGYVKTREKWGNLLDKLSDVVDVGINVVLTAHSEVKKFEDPTEMGAYDRYELKLAKRSNAHIAGVTKEWADMVLFLNYDVIAVKRDGMSEKFAAQGGRRMMFTTHHPAYDAKNRFGLPEKLPLEYSGIAHVIPDMVSSPTITTQVTQPVVTEIPTTTPTQLAEDLSLVGTQFEQTQQLLPSYLPKELVDLMSANNVTEDELTGVMGLRGHFPINTTFETIAKSTPEYFTGGLAANWESVMQVVLSVRQDPSQLVELYKLVGEPNPEAKVQSLKINK